MPRDTAPAAARALAAASTWCSVPEAGAFFGIGVNGSYELVRQGEFPVRVLRLGRQLRVPTADLLRALGLATPETASGEPVATDSPAAPLDQAAAKQEGQRERTAHLRPIA